jgi:hypothetical protein
MCFRYVLPPAAFPQSLSLSPTTSRIPTADCPPIRQPTPEEQPLNSHQASTTLSGCWCSGATAWHIRRTSWDSSKSLVIRWVLLERPGSKHRQRACPRFLAPDVTMLGIRISASLRTCSRRRLVPLGVDARGAQYGATEEYGLPRICQPL